MFFASDRFCEVAVVHLPVATAVLLVSKLDLGYRPLFVTVSVRYTVAAVLVFVCLVCSSKHFVCVVASFSKTENQKPGCKL